MDIPTKRLYAASVMAADIQASYGDQHLMVVSPDFGGVVRARALAKRLDNAPLAIVDSLDRVLPWEVLDTYGSLPASADGLDPDTVANLEPRLGNLECDKPHKLGGQIDPVYGDPLKNGHILLFQLASDAATGWI